MGRGRRRTLGLGGERKELRSMGTTISSMMRMNAQGNQKKRDGWMGTMRNLLENGRKRKRREGGTLVIVIQLSVDIETGIETGIKTRRETGIKTRREERETGKRLVRGRRKKSYEKRKERRRGQANEGWNWLKKLLRQ